MRINRVLSSCDRLTTVRSLFLKPFYLGIKNGTICYRVRSSIYSSVYYDCSIELQDFNPDSIEPILDYDAKFHCSCPAYLYQGYQYWSTRRGISINRELRRPTVHHPDGGILLCKHLIAALNHLIKNKRIIQKDLEIIYDSE